MKYWGKTEQSAGLLNNLGAKPVIAGNDGSRFPYAAGIFPSALFDLKIKGPDSVKAGTGRTRAHGLSARSAGRQAIDSEQRG